ncbi:LysR family transcriptional regulator [Oceanimonas marisflavi]|uniref:LysR family transcriptional regulator n=1 Tax=Oceanimonas marisflavi TaxID=2059724 RepID=UPI000D2F6B7B|nr:LysR family transcriptional regulator [Oceanimonas marisflavi]
MRVELRQIRQFMAVAETLNFRQAAENLAVAQPALSRGIQLLEHQLGVRLFDRNNRRVALTAAGAVFLKGCDQLLIELEETVRKTRQADSGVLGSLTIGYTDFAITGILPGLIDTFRRQYPEISIDLEYGSTQEQLEALANRKIDVAFLTSPLNNDSFEHYPVQVDRFVAVLPESHPLASQDEVDIHELADEPFVVGVMARWRHFRRHLDALCLQAGFQPRIVQEAYNSEGMFGLISANIGITIHLECARNYQRSGVVMLPLTGTDSTVITEAVWHNENNSPLVRHFTDALTPARRSEKAVP